MKKKQDTRQKTDEPTRKKTAGELIASWHPLQEKRKHDEDDDENHRAGRMLALPLPTPSIPPDFVFRQRHVHTWGGEPNEKKKQERIVHGRQPTMWAIVCVPGKNQLKIPIMLFCHSCAISAHI